MCNKHPQLLKVYWLVVSVSHNVRGLDIEIMIFIITNASSFNLFFDHKWHLCENLWRIYAQEEDRVRSWVGQIENEKTVKSEEDGVRI